MIINSNDIFSQIGFVVDPLNKNNFVSKPKFTICLEIQLSQDEKHILEVKDTDNPRTIAVDFCQKHRLNKLAVNIVQAKIREAKQIEQEKYKKSLVNTKTYNTKNAKNQSKLQKSQTKGNTSKRQSPLNQKSSKKLLNKKDQSRTPNKQVSKSKSKSKLESTSDNIYLRSLVKTRLIEEQRNKMKVQMEKKQQEQLTFKPKINNVSQKIIQFLKTNNVPKQKKPSPPKKMYQQMVQCTFKPKINKVSERIINNRSALRQQRDQYNNLYNQGKEKQSKKVVQDEQFPFKPQINPKSAQKVTIPFFKRLQITQQKRNKQATKQTYYDQDQCSFQPKIGRPPTKGRNKQNHNIWQHLHYGSKKDDGHICSTDVGVSQISRDSKASQQYYENLIQERISFVFGILDDNKDGLISPNQIAIQLLPVQCLHFLKPIFMEMDEVDATLNYYEFKKAVHTLMADSDPGSKGSFLSAKWKKQIDQRQSFKPNINKRSKELSVHRSVQNLYKDGLRQKQNKQYKLQKERALKQQKQLAQCSFKPALNRSSKVYIDKITKKKTQMKPNKSLSEMITSFMKQNDDKQ